MPSNKIFIHLMCLVVFVEILVFGCNNNPSQTPSSVIPDEPLIPKYDNLKSIEYYEEKLLDESFRWDGPESNEERIPYLQAARALAYIGDPAVPALFRAVRNEALDSNSIYDALQEIGLPVYDYVNDIYDRHDPTALEQWWKENREKTKAARSEYRKQIGLPPIDAVDAPTSGNRPD